METNPQVIAVMDAKKIVVQFSNFNNEDQLDRTMKRYKGTDHSVRVMSKEQAKTSMTKETPVAL